MPFDSSTRNKLSRMVSDARKLLTGEFTGQMQEIYGIQPDGTVIEIDKLTHLDNEEFEIARALREKIDHIAGEGGMDKREAGSAINRLIHEEAFTVLNRFAALRMCEERGLIQESVKAGVKSKGFLVYSTVCESGLGTTFERYKTYLFCLFDEIAVDLGLLFDRYGGKGILFPRESALLELLETINRADLKDLWAEDETIGWIYQYFNSKEEREAMRQASAAPRNSHELAVRNQFFTPRYVVEFLTDNTLGRIWYEMRKGETELKEKCRYLVRRPTEIFLNPGEGPPEQEKNDSELSQEELLKQPVHIPHRLKKDPREIRMLDPAGGSGHFGLYAFDLFEIIYAEAYDDPDLGPALQQDYPDRTNFLHEVPRLILMHNIHIIDIDPRAVQIAALALWLRAQKSYNALKLKPAERPHITKTNVVCAEPMPGEIDLLKEFTASITPRLLGQIVEIIFEKMKLAGEAGTLLKIEEEIQDAIAKAKEQWLRGSSKEQGELFPELEHIEPLQGLLFDLSDITDEEFWEHAEEKILDALEAYAEQAENGRATKRRLFAEDTAQGFAFIDLCRKRYEVVLMNPPFGEASSRTESYLERLYDEWAGNLLCAFVARTQNLQSVKGLIGVIFDRTASIKSSYDDFRRKHICTRIWAVADTGWNVLDANVETTVHVLTAKDNHGHAIFLDVRDEISDKKANSLVRQITELHSGNRYNGVYISRPALFLKLPNSVIGYYFDDIVLDLFERFKNLEQVGLQARQGHALVSAEHFRLFWEIRDPSTIGINNSFSTLYNGGDFSLFAVPGRDIAKHGSNGVLVKGHSSVVLRNPDFQFWSGVGYGKRGDILDAHLLWHGALFTSEGQAITKISKESALMALAFLNSSLCQYTINQYCGQHKHCGYVNLLPFPSMNPKQSEEVMQNAFSAVQTKRKWFSFDETCLEFSNPLFGISSSSQGGDLAEIISKLSGGYADDSIQHQTRINSNDVCFERAAALRDDEIETLRRYIVRRPVDSPWPDIEKDRSGDILEKVLLREYLSHIFGVILGRWDIRIALDLSLALALPDPFDPLPICPPGMLVGTDSLPARLDNIVSEEWLRKRADGGMKYADGKWTIPAGDYSLPAALCLMPTDAAYPIRISWPGILVDDENHPEDIVRRVREVLDVLWGERSEAIEQEACSILGVKSLRDYFRSPSGFYQDHLKRYSKSRRKAPIYWPLSTASGSYTLWIYYHRLTDQTRYLCITDYVNPKLENTRKDIERLQAEIAKGGTASQRNMLEKLIDFEQELKDFRDELLRVAKLPYVPNLNDGVMIAASPLWKLFRHTSWRKDLEECWRKLEAGEYDWAHITYTLWPERVKEKCKTDKSIAIAHDLEHLYEEKATEPKKPRKSKSKTGGTLT